jgi:hypothetical protein
MTLRGPASAFNWARIGWMPKCPVSASNSMVSTSQNTADLNTARPRRTVA